MLTLRDHTGYVLTMERERVLLLTRTETLGWDYLDDNGNWYALRALLPFHMTR